MEVVLGDWGLGNYRSGGQEFETQMQSKTRV